MQHRPRVVDVAADIVPKITLRSVSAAPLSFAMPAAKQTSHGAVLRAIVTFSSVSEVADEIDIAPPSPVRAVLPTNVELMMLPSSTPPCPNSARPA
jgi:hypothetical protein